MKNLNEMVDELPEEPETARNLSDEEVKALVSDNVELAFWWAEKWKNIPGVSREDIQSQAIHGLVKAANTFDPAKGKFSSYASRIIKNYLGHLNYHEKDKSYNEVTSLDAPIEDTEGGEGSDTLHSKVKSDVDTADIPLANTEADNLIRAELEQIKEPNRSMVIRWMKGESYRDLQKDFKLSFMQIRNIVNAEMQKMKTRLSQKGILKMHDVLPESMEEKDGQFILECLRSQISIWLASQE
jgi:RNA polymerase sigma factor (sigma-70 family)